MILFDETQLSSGPALLLSWPRSKKFSSVYEFNKYLLYTTFLFICNDAIKDDGETNINDKVGEHHAANQDGPRNKIRIKSHGNNDERDETDDE